MREKFLDSVRELVKKLPEASKIKIDGMMRNLVMYKEIGDEDEMRGILGRLWDYTSVCVDLGAITYDDQIAIYTGVAKELEEVGND